MTTNFRYIDHQHLSVKATSQELLGHARNMFFRQSMLKDYMVCPKMAAYEWILPSSEQKEPEFFSAVLGTAGHAVIEHIYTQRLFSMSREDINKMLYDEFVAELQKIRDQGKVVGLPTGYKTYRDAFFEPGEEYTDMIVGYCEHKMNRSFHTSIKEQGFVLIIKDVGDGNPESSHNYIFTGTIDQAGFYESGQFAVRDTKFRDNSFRPSVHYMSIDPQMTMYAAAIRWGVPSCDNCKPRYEMEESFSLDRGIVYSGPCDTCKQKIGTGLWPQRFPERCEMIWMRDFLKRPKDQYARYVKDPSKPRVINPATGKYVQDVSESPKWLSGYKKGDYSGPCFIVTYREPHILEPLMADLVRIAKAVRAADFYRMPGQHCSFWCKHKKRCTAGLEYETAEALGFGSGGDGGYGGLPGDEVFQIQPTEHDSNHGYDDGLDDMNSSDSKEPRINMLGEASDTSLDIEEEEEDFTL